MRFGVIYKVTCISNGNFLYGSTLSIKDRINGYNSGLSRGVWNNPILQNCYNKYGKDSIKFEVVQENIPEDILEGVEDLWIIANNSRADCDKGGMNLRDASRVNFTEEVKKKMSITRTGKKRSKESIEKQKKTWRERFDKGLIKPIWPNNKGRKLSQEHIEKMRKNFTGKKWSKESIEKRTASLKANKLAKKLTLLNNEY